jgi:hypothetical protein
VAFEVMTPGDALPRRLDLSVVLRGADGGVLAADEAVVDVPTGRHRLRRRRAHARAAGRRCRRARTPSTVVATRRRDRGAGERELAVDGAAESDPPAGRPRSGA